MKMGKRSKVTADWLRKGRMVEDLTILRDLIADSSAWTVETAKLDESLFEQSFGLRPLPDKSTTGIAINRAIGHEEVTDKVTTRMKPLVPFGLTIRSQVSSLLPTNLSPAEIDTLSYVFSRFVLEDTPKDTDWPIVPEGLDSLSAALFTINMVSHLIGKENPWLLPLWLMKIRELRMESLLKIYDALVSGNKIDDIIDDIEEVKETLTSLPPQDPLYEVITKWLSALDAVKKKAKQKVAQTINATASKVLDQINLRKRADHEQLTLTHWNIHALRPDGPTASVHESFLKMFRENINILDYEPLVKVCEFLSNCEEVGRPTAADIEKVVSTKRRMSHYTLQKMSLVLTERFIPSMTKLGLKYRFIFSEKRKPLVRSNGLLERMELAESDYETCTVILEPKESRALSQLIPSSSLQLTADSELISLRLDLYDRKSGKWEHGPWDEPSKSKRRTQQWLFRESQYDKKSPVKLTSRQIDLLGPVLTYRGLRGSRMWMLNELGIPEKTARGYIRKMLDEKVLRLLYTPALEYCGLPEGLIAVSRFKQKQLRDSFIEWLTERVPYARIFTDRSTSMIAFIRLPLYSTDIVAGAIEEKNTKSITARLRSYKSYQMTVFHRLLQKDGIVDQLEE